MPPGKWSRDRFYSPWVRAKTCPLFEFSVEGAKGPALQAIDEKPRRLRQNLLRSCGIKGIATTVQQAVRQDEATIDRAREVVVSAPAASTGCIRLFSSPGIETRTSRTRGGQSLVTVQIIVAVLDGFARPVAGARLRTKTRPAI